MEPLLHFTLPFVAMALLGLKFKKALVASAAALVLDMDFLLHIHRSLSHSFVVVMIAMAVLLALTFRSGLKSYVLLSMLAISSHLVFDLFTYYTPVLWPLYGDSVWIVADLKVHYGSALTLLPNFSILTQPVSFQPFQSAEGTLLSSEGLIISVMLLVAALFVYVRRTFQD